MKRTSKILFLIAIFATAIGSVAYAFGGGGGAGQPRPAAPLAQQQPSSPDPVSTAGAPVRHSSPYAGPDAAHQAVPILVYHSFGPAPAHKESKMQLHYRITPENFEKQMKYLSDNGYRPVTFVELSESFANKTPLPDKAIVLTFDDGWKSQYEYALPILEKYKFRGTFFIISNLRTGPYMSWDKLRDLVAKGHDIESHSETHPILTKLDDAKLKSELSGSKESLEKNLNITVSAIAYPNYMNDARVRDAVRSAGYASARAGWEKFANSADHLFELKSQEPVNNPDPFSEKRLPDGR